MSESSTLNVPDCVITVGDITAKFDVQFPSLNELQEKYNKGESIKSKVQEFGGFKTWFLFYPNGDNRAESGYASGFMGIIPPEEAMSQIEVNAEISVGSVQKSFEKDLVICEFKLGRGGMNLISHSQLLKDFKNKPITIQIEWTLKTSIEQRRKYWSGQILAEHKNNGEVVLCLEKDKLSKTTNTFECIRIKHMSKRGFI